MNFIYDIIGEFVTQHGWVVMLYWLFNALVQTAPDEKEILSWWGRWFIRALHWLAGSIRLVFPNGLTQYHPKAKFGRRKADDEEGNV